MTTFCIAFYESHPWYSGASITIVEQLSMSAKAPLHKGTCSIPSVAAQCKMRYLLICSPKDCSNYLAKFLQSAYTCRCISLSPSLLPTSLPLPPSRLHSLFAYPSDIYCTSVSHPSLPCPFCLLSVFISSLSVRLFVRHHKEEIFPHCPVYQSKNPFRIGPGNSLLLWCPKGAAWGL